MNTKYYLRVFVAVVAAILFTGVPPRAFGEPSPGEPYTINVSGEIAWIDVKLGKLQLKTDANQNTRGIEEYRINENETRVTDPSDEKFLTINDLLPGQHVTMEVIYNQEEKVIRKITADPYTAPNFQVASGELESMNVPAGTFILDEKPLLGEGGKGNLTYFVFDPNRIAVIENMSTQPAHIELIPGDQVKVEFVVIGGSRHANSITLLARAPETTSTTTTTTTSTTVIQ